MPKLTTAAGALVVDNQNTMSEALVSSGRLFRRDRDVLMPKQAASPCKVQGPTATISCRVALRLQLCSMCFAPIEEHRKIAPEAATHLVQLCGLSCHEAWRHSRPVVARLAARGRDLSVGE